MRTALFFISLLFACPKALFASREDASLARLTSGARIRFEKMVLIPANSTRALLVSKASMICFVQMHQSEHFDRVIPIMREYAVSGAKKGGVSAPHRIRPWIEVEVDSKSISGVLCSLPLNGKDPKISDFRRAMHGSLRLQLPSEIEEVSE